MEKTTDHQQRQGKTLMKLAAASKWTAASLWLIVLLAAAPSVLHGQEIGSMFDSNFNKAALRQVERVAIIPNRLPLVLQEPARWREANWKKLSKELRENGFEVVPYEETLRLAEQANLPLEDTLSSEDKYYEFSRLADADMVIMPYYGTTFVSKSALLVNTFSYFSTVSLQYYYPNDNVFVHRADSVGEESYSTGWGTILVVGSALLDPLLEADGDLAQIGSVVGLVVTIFDLFKSATPATTRYDRAFNRAVSDAVEPFVSARRTGR